MELFSAHSDVEFVAEHSTGTSKGPIMIRGMHAMFYSSEAEALRAFLRDKLQLPGTDVGGGW
jgi:hypothetical protein